MRWVAILAIAACSRSPIPEVKIYGALREMIHEGRVEARVRLADVVGPGVYGLGALAGMRGEVTIVDGKPWIALGESDDGRGVPEARDLGAALLVVATIPAWREVAIESDIAAKDLDARIESYLVATGVAMDQPVPFVFEGGVDASWHVLIGPPTAGSSPHDHARNARTGRFVGTATVVGFFSKHHVGVFTHMGHSVHVHVVDPSSALAAHADELAVRAGSTLRLPR